MLKMCVRRMQVTCNSVSFTDRKPVTPTGGIRLSYMAFQWVACSHRSKERNSAHIWWQSLERLAVLDGNNSRSLANGTPLVRRSLELLKRTSAVFWASALPKLGPASPKLWLSIYIIHFNITASYTHIITHLNFCPMRPASS